MILDTSGLARLALTAGPALLFKVTLLLGLGAAVAWLLRRRSAASRHFAWLATMTGVLGITALAALPRGVEVVVPRWASARVAAVAPSPGRVAMDAPVQWPMVASGVAGPSHASAARIRAGRPPVPARFGAWLIGLWIAGACIVMAWLALGHFRLARLAMRSEPVDAPAWWLLLDRIAGETGERRALRLRVSPDVGAPIVCGLFRPVILLPADAEAWGSERRRVVLLHELAHVTRRDPLTQSLAWVVCAAWWFHPGVWAAATCMRAESERACDDRVLSFGVAAPDYATHLLSLARRARALRFAGAISVAMARRSTLEGRLLSLLDDSVRRGPLGARVRFAGLATLAVIVLSMGVVRPVPRAAAVTPAAWAAAPEPATAPEAAKTPKPAKPAAPEKGKASAADDPSAVETGDASAGQSGEALVLQQDAKPGETLVLDLKSGGTLAIRGWDQNQVEVRGGLAGRDAKWQKAEMNREGSRIVLNVEPTKYTDSFSTSNHFTIRVPRRFDIKLQSAGGKVTLQDVEGTFSGSCGGGGLEIEHAKGRATLTTGGGDIRVTDCELSGFVSTGGGAVRLSRVKGGLRASSGSGPVIYSVNTSDGRTIESIDPGNLKGLESLGTLGARLGKLGAVLGDLGDLSLDESDVITLGENEEKGLLHLEKAGGAIHLTEAPNGVKATTGGGDITIGRAGGTVDASTGGGDIEIGPASGSVRAGTGAGDVHVILSKASAPRTIDLTSGQGDMVIEIPRGLAVDLDLETSYTRSSEPATIHSDVPIKLEPGTGWDDREGTPRRYVHARSTGKGTALVRVKTVNGNIEIRTRDSSI